MTQDGKTVVIGNSVRICSICAAYVRVRGDRIRAEIRRTTPPAQRLDRWRRFMAGVHQRHLAPGRITNRKPIPNLEETR